MTRADYIMVGGFLGAGKTTAILRMAHSLARAGRRVGLITNDQSFGLVDTTLAAAQGFPVEEITGGCFCCRFNSLVEASEKLTRASAPDVFVAEPVGSCTDLRAAVSYPLRRMYGDNFRIAPLSVLVDPVRAARVLGLEAGRAFSPKVLYIYRKQLEEAEFIVINKCDLVDAERLAALHRALGELHPRAEVFTVSARHGSGMDDWLQRVCRQELTSAPAPDLDYELYAEGEARLGWLNCTAQVRAATAFDGNRLLRQFAEALRQRLASRGIEIAHLKMTLSADELGGDLAVLNLVRNDAPGEMAYQLAEEMQSGEWILNLRAEGEPRELAAAVSAVRDELAAEDGVVFAVEHEEAFQPAKPSPSYRLATA